ncbi:MAG: hypothetical protein WBD09_02855 [Halobacteriota archaeon]
MKWRFFALFATLAFILVFVSSIDVVTLFQGSHNVIDISSSSNDINCTWCHQWVQDNLSSSAEGIHADFRCEDCHRIKDTEIVFASHGKSGEQAHAAYTPRCLDCHGGSGKQIESKFAPPAPAFNESTPLYGSDVSAHKPLVNWSLGYNLSVGENEACIACHTNYSIKNVFKRPEFFDFTLEFDQMNLNFTIHEIAGPNTTTISKSDSGAKHEFKAINQIKCEDCHSDVWQAANHTELNQRGLPKASHVCWRWDKSGGMQGGNDPMHNVSYVEASPGYDNITEYCTLSCHKPRINPNPPVDIPPVFDETIHAAYRLSCYHCHNSSSTDYYKNATFNKPKDDWDTPKWGHSEKHNDIDDEVLGEKLFLNAETCIACKRDGADFKGGRYIIYTEPNNTIYKDSNPI